MRKRGVSLEGLGGAVGGIPMRSLAWAAWIIARLGGWNCYYKPPGPITFRRGMAQFYPIHRGRQLEMMLKREVRIP